MEHSGKSRKPIVFLLTLILLSFAVIVPTVEACGWGGESDFDPDRESLVVGKDGLIVPEPEQIDDPWYQTRLGNIYREGSAIKQNLKMALSWYQKAAKQNHADAINNIAAMYEQGLGVKKNIKTALDLYIQAAKLGHAKAMHSVAEIKLAGNSKNNSFYDQSAGMKWLNNSARAGHHSAMLQLG